jgi:teichuronic acid exporter
MSLQNKAISGVFWSFLQKLGAGGIYFIVTILLARKLSPNDFGLVGMISIFIQIGQTLIDGGFSLALIQKKNIDEEDYSSVFYINLIVSSALYLLIFFAAPFIADFYKQPSLVNLIRVLSFVFIINAFSNIQETRLIKDVRFKTLMIIHIPSAIFGGLISIAMAFAGFGPWCIVFMQLITNLAYSIQIWIYAKWRPLLIFNISKAKSLFSFGGKLLISRILTNIYDNIFLVLIGKFYPIHIVGYYQNAYNLTNVPSSIITSVLNSVTFPVFSIIQDDDKRLKQGYRKVMQQAFFFICPVYLIACVVAHPLYQIIFTEKWIAAVPYFQWLCIAAIFQPLTTYNLNIVNVKGRSDVFLNLQMVRRIITIVAIIVAFPFGIKGLLIVQAYSSIFTFLLFSYFGGKFIHYGLLEQVKDILPILLLSIGSGAIVFLTDHVLEFLPNLLRITIDFIIGIVAYTLVAKTYKFSSFINLSLIIEQKVLKRSVIKN